MRQQEDESLGEDVRQVLERFWAGTPSIESFLWEAPDLHARVMPSGGEIPVGDWIKEMVFHLSEIDAGLERCIAAGPEDELQEPASDLLFHCFSALGYHLLGVLEQAAVERSSDLPDRPGQPSPEPGTRAAELRQVGETVRSALHAVSSLKNLEGDEFVGRFAQWLSSTIAALAYFASVAVPYRVPSRER
jgi:hypothetical protein